MITNNINLIRDHCSAEHGNKFDAWITTHIAQIKEDEFAQIQRDEMDASARKNIVEAVQKMLTELDREEV